MSNKKFIAECTTYDFKQALERRKVKSWLKSVSAFANTEGGSLFFGVADDGSVIGLDDVVGCRIHQRDHQDENRSYSGYGSDAI